MGMRENASRGWRAGGRAPIGYRLERYPMGADAYLKRHAPAFRGSVFVPDYVANRAVGHDLRTQHASDSITTTAKVDAFCHVN